MKLRKIIGQNIKMFRNMKNLTQNQLGDKVDLTYEMISKIENGRVNFSVDRLISIAEILEIPPEELFMPNPRSLSLKFTISDQNIKKLDELVKIIKELAEENK